MEIDEHGFSANLGGEERRGEESESKHCSGC
jgi:hypothetical protein